MELGARQPGSRGREVTPQPERAGESSQRVGAENQPQGWGGRAGQGSTQGDEGDGLQAASTRCKIRSCVRGLYV